MAGVVALALTLGDTSGDASAEETARPLVDEPAQPAGAISTQPEVELPRAAVAEEPREEQAASPEDLRLRADQQRQQRAARDDGKRFQGRGKIRGFIDVSDDSAFPTEWSLVLEPSTTLAGRERAVSQVIEFTAGEQEFVIDNLPLAGYDVYAQAAGWNARRHAVLLDRDHDNPYITLVLYAAGYLEGRVLDHAGMPAEGLLVTLKSLASTGGAPEVPRDTRCNVLGQYRFDGVLDGEYELRFGPPIKPLLEVERLRFTAPSMTFPDRELPLTHRVQILTLDDRGDPVPEVRVRASSTAGLVDVTTDGFGKAEAGYLPPGRYRFSSEREGYRTGRLAIDLVESREVVLRFPPPYR